MEPGIKRVTKPPIRRVSAFGAAWIAIMLASAAFVATPAAARLAGDRIGARSATVTAARAPIAQGVTTSADKGTASDQAKSQRPRARSRPALLVRVSHNMQMRARPNSASPVIGVLPESSKYYHVPTTAWVEVVSHNRQWGRVQVPYVSPRRNGWIRLSGVVRAWTKIAVEVDLSAHRVTVTKAGVKLFSFPAATGSASSPTPTGRYFVTDRIPFWRGSALGSFAFGISGIQPRLPYGWTGGNQLAIHGTNNPASIGTSASAGCVRVSEEALAKLRPLLLLGTPVVVHG